MMTNAATEGNPGRSMLTASPRLAAIDPPEEPLPLLRQLRTMVDNPLKAWPAALYRKPLYRSRILGHPTIYVMAPDLVRAVLLDESDSFEKGEVARRALGSALGDSILLADGPRWLWQRRAVAPIFRPERIRHFLPAMIAAAERTRDRWRALPPGSEIDVAKEMALTTFDIIVSSMLSGPGSIDAELLQRSMGGYIEPISWVMALATVGAPRWLPYPGIFRARRARENLHRMLEALIAETREAPDNAGNLLWLLVHASDPQTGKSMNAVDVRNNLLTFITAGHETTALALTWTFYLLSLHPEAEWRAKQEIAALTRGGRLLPEHVDALAYTSQVIQEAMRLYPPAAAVVRAARRDVQIGNEHVSAGTTVYVPVYAIHRHEALWQEPNRFEPARFEPEAAKARDRYAYLPFGAGPRVCIGQSFAQREAIAILATLLSAFQLRLRPGHHPEPRLRVTLRPAGGMPMRVIASS
jgi:cytochrome P450